MTRRAAGTIHQDMGGADARRDRIGRNMMSTRIKAALLCAGMALTLGACGKKAPTGQVVATINGTEVTLQEVNAELGAANIPEGADKKLAMRSVLQRVVDRKLLAGEATKRDLDKNPDYLGQKLRLDETLLAQQYVKQQVSTLPQPTAADLSGFMADNPNMFAQRAQLVVDQIRFPTPAQPAKLKGLESAHSQAEVATALTGMGIRFERGKSAIDTAVLPAQVVAKINALPPGEPFVLPAQGILTINVIQGRTAAQVPEAQARTVAANGWRERQFGKLLNDKVVQLRKDAKITYQPGFEPPAGAPGAPAAPAAPAAKP